MPDALAERLRVLASHERERLLLRVNLAVRLRNWKERVQLSFDNMMRPLALPFAGGLLSALGDIRLHHASAGFPLHALCQQRCPASYDRQRSGWRRVVLGRAGSPNSCR